MDVCTYMDTDRQTDRQTDRSFLNQTCCSDYVSYNNRYLNYLKRNKTHVSQLTRDRSNSTDQMDGTHTDTNIHPLSLLLKESQTWAPGGQRVCWNILPFNLLMSERILISCRASQTNQLL